LIREIEVLKKCGEHKNIVKIRDSIEEANNFYLITELIEGIEFFLYLKKAILNEK
jgi:serine/threonine protein kinase